MSLTVVHGLRRSGNHAVIRWMRSGQGPSVFLNDCRAGDPYWTFAQMETPEGELHGRRFRQTRWFPQFPANRDRAHVVSYEDTAPEATGDPEGFAQPSHRTIVWRSFPNWLASFKALTERQRGTRWGLDDPMEIAGLFPLYADLVRPRPGVVHVHYDRWARDASYRDGLADRLSLRAPRMPLATECFGGGPSFDGGDPTERWRAASGNGAYRALMRLAVDDGQLMSVMGHMDPRAAEITADLAETSDTA